MPSWGTATLLEIIWTLCAALGVLATAYGVWVAWLDMRAVASADPRLRRLAKVFVRYESALALTLSVNLIIGIRAMSVPSAQAPDTLDWGAVLAGVLFVLSGVVLTTVSIQNRLARRANDANR